MSQYWNLRINMEDNTTSVGNADVEGYGQISILLSKYVLKEKGKGLSSNDFTDSYKNKLDSIEAGAEINVLETISVNNGNPIFADDNKNININVPTKISELQNDLSYAKLISDSEFPDYSDSYVGKSKFSFQEETDIPIGKNANATNNGIAIGDGAIANDGVAIGYHTCTSPTYDVNINNQAKHNKSTSLWEMKTTNSELADVATTNSNGTNLNQLDTVIEGLSNEITNRCNADITLQCNIDDEITNRCNADIALQCNIDNETSNRCSADITLQNNINNVSNSLTYEAETRNCVDGILQNGINAVNNKVTTIESYIPNQTSSENKLADKDFVNSSIQTNTANFRGNWTNWSDVPSVASDYPSDYSGSTTPTVNDYMVVQDASDYSLETLNGTWRFKYTGDWDINDKNGWLPEYQVNEEPLTSEQIYALNSGITCDKVTCYDNHINNTNNPHNVTKSQIGLSDVDNTSDNVKCVKDSVCFNSCTYAEACADIRDGLVTISDTIDDCDIPIALCTDTTSVGKSNDCSLTFNPSTGTLTSDCFNGNSKNSVCFNGYTYAETCADIRNGLGTITSIQFNDGATCCCEITTSGIICLGSNAWNSTAFTTCVGTVTISDKESDDSDTPIALCTDTTSVGKSNGCSLTFNTSTGVLCATAFCGILCGGISFANCAECDCDGCPFGTASRYDCSCFRSSTWTPSCVACAGQSYCVMDYCSNSTPLYVGYANTGLNCSQVTHLAAFSTNYISGKTIIKDASKDVIKSWLGLGSSAYCSANCFRSASWTPTSVSYADSAGSASYATYAYCLSNSAGSAWYRVYVY